MKSRKKVKFTVEKMHQQQQQCKIDLSTSISRLNSKLIMLLLYDRYLKRTRNINFLYMFDVLLHLNMCHTPKHIKTHGDFFSVWLLLLECCNIRTSTEQNSSEQVFRIIRLYYTVHNVLGVRVLFACPFLVRIETINVFLGYFDIDERK